jgi:hypothetical protein
VAGDYLELVLKCDGVVAGDHVTCHSVRVCVMSCVTPLRGLALRMLRVVRHAARTRQAGSRRHAARGKRDGALSERDGPIVKYDAALPANVGLVAKAERRARLLDISVDI